ncbi:MAG: glutaredoxin domain-containing protein [Sphingomonadaceae bacterium]
MPRSTLDFQAVHPAVQQQVATFHASTVQEVQTAVASHAVVVVGMRQNPFPRKARQLLDQLGTPYHYLEYGSYLSGWKPRLALKMWSGWPTLPMVFVHGTLVGGAQELGQLIASGAFATLLAAGRPA